MSFAAKKTGGGGCPLLSLIGSRNSAMNKSTLRKTKKPEGKTFCFTRKAQPPTNVVTAANASSGKVLIICGQISKAVRK